LNYSYEKGSEVLKDKEMKKKKKIRWRRTEEWKSP
jgi:hypothetical protein